MAASPTAAPTVRPSERGRLRARAGQRHQLQDWDPSVRAIRPSSGSSLCRYSVWWKANVEPDVTSYSVGARACEKGEERQAALAPLCEKLEAKLEPDVVHSAGSSACEKSEPWQQYLSLLSEMEKAKLEPDVRHSGVISYSVGIRACEKGAMRERGLAGCAAHRRVLSCSAAVGQREMEGEQWQQATALWPTRARREGRQWRQGLSRRATLGTARARKDCGSADTTVSSGKRSWSPNLDTVSIEPPLSYRAGINSSEKGRQAVAADCHSVSAAPSADRIGYRAGIVGEWVIRRGHPKTDS